MTTAARWCAWIAVLAACVDATTTWVLLRSPGGYEQNPAIARLMDAVGVGPALAIRVVVAALVMTVLGALVYAADRRARVVAAWFGLSFLIAFGTATAAVATWNASLLVR